MIWPTKNLIVCAIKHTAMHLLVDDSVITGFEHETKCLRFQNNKITGLDQSISISNWKSDL